MSPEALAKIDGLSLLAADKMRTPSKLFIPNSAGQRAFFAARQRKRFLFPGNRFGKTTVMGIDADRTLQSRKCQCWWIPPQLRQFQEIKPQLDRECFTQGYDFNGSDLTLTWPNGSRLTVWPADRDPHYVQGPNPAKVYFDEEPPKAMWTECLARGVGSAHGGERTGYVIAATAMGGMTWLYEDIYKPWLDWHAARGLDEDRAMLAQLHPDFWVWPKGGIHDNASITPKDAEEWARQDWGGPKQAKVRVFGGFADWRGDAVFDADALADARKDARPGEIVSLTAGPDETGLPNRVPVLATTTAILAGVRAFETQPMSTEGGRLEVWKPPEYGRLYVVGADFAYGIEGRDWDTACVLRVPGAGEKPEQVCEAQGHWGPDFERILYALLRFYNDAYLLGEAQVGLITLRRLRDEYQYTRMFSERTEAGRERGPGTRLGYHTSAADVTLPKLRRFMLDRAGVWRSAPLIDQMGRLQFRPTSERVAAEATDAQLRVKLSGGGSPDLVRAAGFAVHALGEVAWETPEVPLAPPGSLGEALGYNETMQPKAKGYSWKR